MVDTAPPTFELQLLGPVRLVQAGQALPLKTRKALALLMLLVLDGGMNRARACELLWPTLDESSARRNLRRELMRVREAGAAAVLRAEGDGLQASAELGCDLLRAESCLAAGRADEAVALWRGAVADGLDAEAGPSATPSTGNGAPAHEAHGGDGLAGPLAALRQRATAVRQQALQQSAAAAESRGDIAGALKQVQALLRIDNLQERQHREAMRLLQASGQREAALRQFDTCRALLASELGVEPTAETLALAEALREGAVPTAPTAPTAATAPTAGKAGTTATAPVRGAGLLEAVALPAQLPFVGRQTEAALMQAAFARGQCLIVLGEGGVGKTRLATDFAAAQGPHASVRCHSGDAESPLSSFTRALRSFAGQPPELSGLEAWVRQELTRLLPELGAAPPPLRNADERSRFGEACVRAWLHLTAEAFDAVVLDDWQWADAASRALVARVAERRRGQAGPGRGAVEILTWRGEANAAGADAAELAAAQQALAAQTVALGPLPAAAVQALVQQLSGRAQAPRFARRLANATGGHPYFIAETLRDLAERQLLRSDAAGRWQTPYDEATSDYRELPLASSVREAVLARVRRLGTPTVRLLEAAALSSQTLAAAQLAEACGLTEMEALQALDEAARAHLVLARDGGGYAWTHELARLAMESALEPTRRRLLHHRLALAAAAQGLSADAAQHFEACGEAGRAVPQRLAAGDAALALHALAEAVQHWQRALDHGPAPADEAALLVRLCEVQWQRGQHQQAHDAHARFRALPSPRLPPATATELDIRAAYYLVQRGDAQEALSRIDAIGLPTEPALLLRWRRARSSALQQCGRPDEALAESQQALQAAPAGSRAQAEVLLSMTTVAHSLGRMAEAVDHAAASEALYKQLGDVLGRARALTYRGAFAVELGQLAAAREALREAAALAGQHGHLHLQRMALYNLAGSYSNDSRPEEALQVAQEAWPALAAAPREEMALVFRTMFVECHFQLGQWGPMWEHLAPAVADVLVRPQPLAMLSVGNCVLEPAAVLGHWPTVLPLVEALGERVFDDMAVAAEIMLGCVHAALIRHDLEGARAWLQRVGPPAALEQLRVRRRAELLHAEVALASGVAAADIPLPDKTAEGMTPELRLRALLLRWRLGRLPREQALAALDDPGAHAAVALRLAQALGGAVWAAHRQRVADGLKPWPALRRGFLSTWA